MRILVRDMLLAGDIGGTKTVLALFEQTSSGLRQVRDATVHSEQYPSLEAILREFLGTEPGLSLEAGCFAVAGPVREGKARTTNLPWNLEEQALLLATGARRVTLINDLQAAAYGMLFLAPEEFEVLHSGDPEAAKGSMAVIAPGTGLGEAFLYWDGQRYHPIASEGGHSDFASRTDEEIELFKYVRAKCGGHVSYERLLSGDGIRHIYSFVRDRGQLAEPAWLRERLQSGDPNATIAQIGVAGEHPLCIQTVELFVSILGAEAGNLALKCFATAGVIVGGGIAPKMLPALRKGHFMAAFTAKGRFSEWIESIPVRVALNLRAPLLGAAHFLVSGVIAAAARPPSLRSL